MFCKDAQSMTFVIYELFPDGKEGEAKEFTITKQENDERLTKLGYYPDVNITSSGVLLVMFNKLYNFTVGASGFSIKWDVELESGHCFWPGPRAPACTIGGNWWKIKRIT